jgi:hypothetical protein
MSIKLWLVASIVAASFTTVANAQEIDWKQFDDTFGRKPAVSADVHRYGFPRTDLAVTLDSVAIKPLWPSEAGSRSNRCMESP